MSGRHGVAMNGTTSWQTKTFTLSFCTVICVVSKHNHTFHKFQLHQRPSTLLVCKQCPLQHPVAIFRAWNNTTNWGKTMVNFQLKWLIFSPLAHSILGKRSALLFCSFEIYAYDHWCKSSLCPLPLCGKELKAWSGPDRVAVTGEGESGGLQQGGEGGDHLHGGVVQVLQQHPVAAHHRFRQHPRTPHKLTRNLGALVRPQQRLENQGVVIY